MSYAIHICTMYSGYIYASNLLFEYINIDPCSLTLSG